ncbi:MAG: hypothetical protein ACKO37_06320 [Vampirovibrionales bacterium]
MTRTLKQTIALSIVLSLFMPWLHTHAYAMQDVAQNTAQLTLHAAEMMSFKDGWKLVNPPPMVNRSLSVPGLWDIQVSTKPILEVLPQGTHPLMARLNQYQTVSFHPHPSLKPWQHTVSLYQVRTDNPIPIPLVETYHFNQSFRTPHIGEEVLSRYPRLDGSQGQQHMPHHKSGMSFGSVIGIILLSPVILVMLLLCSPFLLQGRSPSSKQYEEETKNETLKGKLIYEHFAPFMHRVTQLQQHFYIPKGYETSHTQALNLPDTTQGRSTYHVLPSIDDYRLNRKLKTIHYGQQWHHWMLFDVAFQIPISARSLKDAVTHQGIPFTLQYVMPDPEHPSMVKRLETSPDMQPTLMLSTCRAAYLLPSFNQLELSCLSN